MSVYRVAVNGPHDSGYGQPIEADSDAEAMELMRSSYLPGIGEDMVVLLVRPDGSTVAEYRQPAKEPR